MCELEDVLGLSYESEGGRGRGREGVHFWLTD